MCPHCCTSPSTPHLYMCVCLRVLLMLCQSGPQPLTPSRCVCACVCLVMLCPLSRSCLLPWHLPSQFIYFCLFLFSVFLYRFFFVFCFLLLLPFAFDFVCLSVEFVCRSRFALDYEKNLWPFHKRVFLHTPHTDTHTHSHTHTYMCLCSVYINLFCFYVGWLFTTRRLVHAGSNAIWSQLA